MLGHLTDLDNVVRQGPTVPAVGVSADVEISRYFLLKSHKASFNQISFRGGGNENIFKQFKSHDQYGCHAYIW